MKLFKSEFFEKEYENLKKKRIIKSIRMWFMHEN